MKIIAARAYLVKLPLTKPYTIAYKVIEDTEIVFLEITLENGMVGLGASNPFEEVVGETPADTLRHLNAGFLDELIGKDIRLFVQLIDTAKSRFPHLPGTLAAIDIALHDLFCQYLDIPLVEFLGKKLQALPTSITLGIKETAEMLEEAKGYFTLGFRILKVKAGLDVGQDIERVTKLREAFGNKMALRVDANQGYAPEQLRAFLRQTKNLDIELIEQPFSVGNDAQLLDFEPFERDRCCADESLHDAKSALELSHAPQPYGIFNIKLMKSGGIFGAREIATIAQNAGIKLFWGCNDESIVSIAAALHTAFSCANTHFLDLDGSFDVAQDLVEGGFILENGLMRTTPAPGLGVRYAAG